MICLSASGRLWTGGVLRCSRRSHGRAPTSDIARAARLFDCIYQTELRITLGENGSTQNQTGNHVHRSTSPARPLKVKCSWRWSSRNLLLLRSSSDYRAMPRKDPIRKVTLSGKILEADGRKNLSFRSAMGRSKSVDRVGGEKAAAIEKTVILETRATTVEKERKMYLPYKPVVLAGLTSRCQYSLCLKFVYHPLWLHK